MARSHLSSQFFFTISRSSSAVKSFLRVLAFEDKNLVFVNNVLVNSDRFRFLRDCWMNILFYFLCCCYKRLCADSGIEPLQYKKFLEFLLLLTLKMSNNPEKLDMLFERFTQSLPRRAAATGILRNEKCRQHSERRVAEFIKRFLNSQSKTMRKLFVCIAMGKIYLQSFYHTSED